MQLEPSLLVSQQVNNDLFNYLRSDIIPRRLRGFYPVLLDALWAAKMKILLVGVAVGLNILFVNSRCRFCLV